MDGRSAPLRYACLAAIGILLSGCGPEQPLEIETAVTPDGVTKPEDGKSDAINAVNDPSRFSISMYRRIQDLPLAGESARKPFPANWWPFASVGIGRRWQGSSVPSPAEKYELLIGSTGAQNWEYWHHGPGINPGSWWGHCNGWASYVLNEEEPLRAVIARMSGDTVVGCGSISEAGCVRFEVGDINALMTELYFSDAFRMLGGRCNTSNPRVDPFGRVVAAECRDANPGALHIVTANMLGHQRRMFIADTTYDLQVWNFPVYKFQVAELKEISKVDALRAIGSLGSSYWPNLSAKRFFKVTLKLWIVEDSIGPRTTPSGYLLSYYTTIEAYTYVLEAASDGTILGGEWTGTSKRRHPDFLWYSYSNSSRSDDDAGDFDNPHLRFSVAKELHRMSRFGTGSSEPGVPAREYASSPNLAIPDNNPAGVRDTIVVPDDFLISGVQVYVEIPHTYIGDLIVTVSHLNTNVTLHRREGGNTDNLVTVFDAPGFTGLSSAGEWILSVSDNAWVDLGRLASWKLILYPQQ